LSDQEILKRLERLKPILDLFPKEMDIVEIEEMAREIAKKIPRLRETITRTLDLKNVRVEGTFNIINSKVGGKLKELVVRSPSPKFSLYILADGIPRITRSYTELTSISQHSELLDAYEENGNYIVRLKDLNWLQNFMATISVEEPTTFNNIWSIWDEYV